jgi:hypothetical protein
VDEPFGPLVNEWDDGSSGKQRRLLGLLDRFRIDRATAGRLRYQLLHRTAATLVEATQAKAEHAALIVQSFSPLHVGFSDFQAFAAVLGIALEKPNVISQPLTISDIQLRLGWANCPLYPRHESPVPGAVHR